MGDHQRILAVVCFALHADYLFSMILKAAKALSAVCVPICSTIQCLLKSEIADSRNLKRRSNMMPFMFEGADTRSERRSMARGTFNRRGATTSIMLRAKLSKGEGALSHHRAADMMLDRKSSKSTRTL